MQIVNSHHQMKIIEISTSGIELYPLFQKKYRYSCARKGSKTAHSVCYIVTNLKNRYFERFPPSFVFTIFPLQNIEKLV